MLTDRSLIRIPLVASFALVAASGCGGGDSIARDDVSDAYVAAICDYFTTCPSTGFESSIIRLVLANSPDGTCENSFGRELDVGDTFDAQIEAGTIRYDGGAAADCLAAIRGSCAGLDAVESIEACEHVYTGTVAIDGACLVDQECVPGAYCDQVAAGTCGGTCKASATVGQACGGNDPNCGSGAPDGVLACRSTAANPAPHCVLERFTEVGAGLPCGQVDQDGDDTTTANCEAGLYCRKVNPGDDVGACAETLAELATCDPQVDVCVAGALCMPGAGGNRCTTVVVQNEPDTACSDLIGPYCNPLLKLDCAAGVCQLVGDGTLGANCRYDFASDCNEGLYCNTDGNSDTGACAALIANGVACDPDEEDQSCVSAYCDSDAVTPTCAEAPVCF